MFTNDPTVIVAAKRTPIGNLMGVFANLSAHQLGSVACRGAIEQAGISPEQIDDVLLGCVLSAGQGQAPARQAAINAGVPVHVGATTINKMCGSGMKTLMLAHDVLQTGNAAIILAGGMESMSQAPYLAMGARAGYRLGHKPLFDHMMLDGLEDAYDKGKSMGYFAEHTAEKYGYTRAAQDEWAQTSMRRILQAQGNGWLHEEIVPVTLNNNTIQQDENPHLDKLQKIAKLKPAFNPQGTITAANASSISDGAAALILMRASQAEKLGITPLAKLCAYSQYADKPAWFTTTPGHAIKKLLQKTSWSSDEVDLYEINEAFAVVTLHAMCELNLPTEKVNIHGGACAIGHPIGASGARIVVTLLNALRVHKKQRGIAAICIGGGEATALALEMY